MCISPNFFYFQKSTCIEKSWCYNSHKRCGFRLAEGSEHKRNSEINHYKCLRKYEILQGIGQGNSSQVYLARHKFLGALRAIKCISKTHPDSNSFLQEGRILQNLNHPGIPRIYDIEEDSDMLFLIEEYVPGMSLQTLRSVSSNFSQEDSIQYGIEICDILQYLHEQRPYNLLYLDLKPEHIIVCKEGIKLIDFGSVTEKRISASRAGILGTPGFCAPEMIRGKTPKEQADVYSVGAVLYYLLEGEIYSEDKKICLQKSGKNDPLYAIIARCLRAEEERYASMALLKKELQGIGKIKQKKKATSLVVAVLGAKGKVGTTHFAIGLTSYLNQMGYFAVYEDDSGSNVVEGIQQKLKTEENAGYIQVKDFLGIPNYGPGIALEYNKPVIRIMDLGIWDADKEDSVKVCDVAYLLCSCSPWESFRLEYPEREHILPAFLKVVVQYGLLDRDKKTLKEKGIKNCYCMPFFQDLWKPGEKTRRFYHQLWNR